MPPLRIARVLEVSAHPNADKLFVIKIDLGSEQRQLCAGLRSHYTPEQLVGRNIVVVANLAPRQMTFGTSEGMVVASGPGGKEVYLLRPDPGAKPGERVH